MRLCVRLRPTWAWLAPAGLTGTETEAEVVEGDACGHVSECQRLLKTGSLVTDLVSTSSTDGLLRTVVYWLELGRSHVFLALADLVHE